MVKIEWSRFKKIYLVNYPKKSKESEFINIYIHTRSLAEPEGGEGGTCPPDSSKKNLVIVV